jgi:hypothetical protein
MGGTGSKQEDQIITAAIEQATGAKFTYVPYKGGGDVAAQLVGGHIDATVNNPIEAVTHWRSGALRPLCVFDSQPMPYPAKVTSTQSWQDIPTCKSQGLDVEYLMLRGIFMPAGVSQEQVDYYVDVFKKVRELPEWKKFTEEAAFNNTFMTGKQYADWVANAENEHKSLMQEAGFIAKKIAMAIEEGGTQGDVATRWVELVVALLIAVGGAVVIVDSLRVGIEWAEDGPKSGYFPFFIGVILVVAGGYIAAKTLFAWRRLSAQVFVSRAELVPVLAMLLPTVAYVVAIYFLGIYLSSVLYIAGFMVWQGRFRWWTVASASVGVPFVLFLLFEVWFLVPLPKGPFERLIGY